MTAKYLPCRYHFADGDCPYGGDNCKFSHSKRRMAKLDCPSMVGGKCPVGSECPMRHARPAQATTPTLACKNHLLGLPCEYGDNCKFSHDARKFKPKNLKGLMNYNPVEAGSEEWPLIVRYIRNTHSPQHGFTVSLNRVSSMAGMGRTERHCRMGPRHNKQLLWHGTDKDNLFSILQNGFDLDRATRRCMFGPGIYFSSCVTKSAQYCNTNDGVAYLLLCEVALGDMHECLKADKHCPRYGTHSTYGIGNLAPNPSHAVERGGVTWPLGRMVACDEGACSSLAHPEFIVYDISQIAIRYVVQVTITPK